MKEKRLYIIAGCNGAGKTTASFNLLPGILACREFVNADEIARGISPFQPEGVAFEAGRIMLNRINELLQAGENFALETTLATKSYKNLVRRAQNLSYFVTLIYYWLENPDLAKKRVQLRVSEGGHNIPEQTIERRYFRGLQNLLAIYLPVCDYSLIYDNSKREPVLVFEKHPNGEQFIHDPERFIQLKKHLT